MRLKDKAIIVTGGTSGIGAAIAAAAIREGAKVLVHGINEEEGCATVEKLGTNAVLCIADLAKDSAPTEIVSAALEAFGKIDSVVNNAAIFGGTNISDQEVKFNCSPVSDQSSIRRAKKVWWLRAKHWFD
jgi:NAD(P)-dependent dehydrogenase (short-subunit alcohol dehydrogenase family)